MKTVTSLERRFPDIQEAFAKVAFSGQYAEGAFTKRAEAALAAVVGKPAVLVNSCGSALYLCYRYLYEKGVRHVLVQNNTFYATGAAAAEAGLHVHLVDSREDCPSMSAESLLAALEHTGTTDVAVCLTHVAGWVAKDYAAIADVCQQHDLFLLEDCAHAMGLSAAGTLGDAACWSFYPTKAVPIGEGGAVTTQHDGLRDFVASFRQYGKHVEGGLIRYRPGLNLRISEWDAAVLTVQLEHLPEILEARRRDAERLQSIAKCLLQGESNFYKYPVKTEDAEGLATVGPVYQESDQLLSAMAAYPDQCSSHVPLNNSAVWANTHKCLPVGEDLYSGLSEDEVRNQLRA